MHHGFHGLSMWNFRDEIHQSFFVRPGRESPEIAAQQLGAEGISDDSRSGAQLLLDLRREAKETGDRSVLVQRQVGEKSNVLAALVWRPERYPRRIHSDRSSNHSLRQIERRFTICPRQESV